MYYSLENILKGVGIIFLLWIGVTTLYIFLLLKWGKKDLLNEIEYETRYRELNNAISHGIHSEMERLSLECLLKQIEELPWKNEEKTQILRDRFLKACNVMSYEHENIAV